MGIDRSELQNEDSFPEDLECPICLGVIVDAVTAPCGHSFCRLCAELALSSKPACPMCRAETSSACLSSDHLVNLRVNALNVCCERKCGWFGRCDQRPGHAKTCAIAQEKEFRVTLQKGLGISFVRAKDREGLFVGKVDEHGAAAEYNQKMAHCPSRQIIPGCVLVEANGVRGDGQTLSAMVRRTSANEGLQTLVFLRYVSFSLVVAKNEKPWGLDVLFQERDLAFLQVEEVDPDGAVMEHNLQPQGQKLKISDRIVEVNGVRGDGLALLNTLRASDTCEFRILRLL